MPDVAPFDLAAACAEWQTTLGLRDWQVDVAWARTAEFGDLYTHGRCYWQDTARVARIRILSPVDVAADAMPPYDPERILVHELLHLHFAEFAAEEETPAANAQERAIHALSVALVTLARGNEESGDGDV